MFEDKSNNNEDDLIPRVKERWCPAFKDTMANELKKEALD